MTKLLACIVTVFCSIALTCGKIRNCIVDVDATLNNHIKNALPVYSTLAMPGQKEKTENDTGYQTLHPDKEPAGHASLATINATYHYLCAWMLIMSGGVPRAPFMVLALPTIHIWLWVINLYPWRTIINNCIPYYCYYCWLYGWFI